ncbi:MAG: hypothetical protein ACI4D0_03425, partial [Lachnospira sp.]
MDLFTLVGSIAVNGAKEAKSDISGVSQEAEKSHSKLASGIKTAAKWGAGIATSAVAAGAAVVGFATKATGTCDTVDKMSQKIGISRQAYQELDFICSQSGMSVDSLQAGMKTLTSAMDGAAGGTKSNIEMFNKLGVSVTDSNGELRSQEDVLWETLSALQGVENQTEKARLATQLFGKSGSEMMPLLNGASGSIEEMKKQANDLGLVLDDTTIDAGVHLTDAMDQVQRSLSAAATSVAGELMPVVQAFCEWLTSNMPTIQNVLGTVISITRNGIEVIVGIINEVAPYIQSTISSISSFIMSTIGGCTTTSEGFFRSMQNTFSSVISALPEIWNSYGVPLMEVMQSVIGS